jgi:membrane-anchored glycerophosphoryl diester phosphodiesterase (GDPDase)
MNFDFGKVLSRSWQIIWKHKVLWIFGILASCARSNGGGGSGGGGNSSYRTGPNGNPPFSSDQIKQLMDRIGQFLQTHLWLIIAIILGLILLSFIFYALGMLGRIGLIKGTFKAENGAESLSFGELWSESMPYFWRIFGLTFLLGLLIFVLIVPFVILGIVTAGIGFLCLLPLVCILIPISWALMVIIEQAQAAIVIEDLGMMDGVRRGWQIAKSNIGPMIIMALILGIGGAIIGVAIAIPIILAVVPIIIGAGTLKESLTPLWIALGCCAAYLPVLIFFNGIITAYIQSAWTLTFMQLSKPQESASVIIEPNA